MSKVIEVIKIKEKSSKDKVQKINNYPFAIDAPSPNLEGTIAQSNNLLNPPPKLGGLKS